MKANRREFIIGAAVAAASSAVPAAAGPASATQFPAKVKPLPLAATRLLPSDYATAVELDRTYLLDLSADRLLHNFLKYARLPPKADIYRGWESDTLSGHTLGHYMTALVNMHEQAGDGECRVRADYIVSELKRAQTARGTGYVGGLGRKRKDGTIVDGEEIFPEVKKGEIHSGGFDLNGSWSPLYTVHKLFAGLLDVNGSWGNATALEIATSLAEYFAGVFDALDDAGVWIEKTRLAIDHLRAGDLRQRQYLLREALNVGNVCRREKAAHGDPSVPHVAIYGGGIEGEACFDTFDSPIGRGRISYENILLRPCPLIFHFRCPRSCVGRMIA